MPKNMKYDAVATKAGAPKNKMKTNQDGGSMTAKDPAAAGKQLMADQKGAAKYKEGPAMGYSQKFGAGRMNGYDMGAAKVADIMTNGGAAKYMKKGGAKMMEKGPAQMKDVKSGERVNVKASDGKTLSVKSGSGFHQQALKQGSVLQSMRPSYPMGDPYEANISEAEKMKRKKATYPKK